jgi:hypothetical protein
VTTAYTGRGPARFRGLEALPTCVPASALRDGVLVDVSAVAREAGTRYPVALTSAGRGWLNAPPGRGGYPLAGPRGVRGRVGGGA